MQSPRQVIVAPDAKSFAEEVRLTQKRLRKAYKLQSEFLDPKKAPSDGRTYTAATVRSIFSGVVKSMDVLTAQYRAAVSKKRRGPPRPLNLNSGIRKPVQIDENMLAFLNAADFGNVRVAVERQGVSDTGKTVKLYVAQEALGPDGRARSLKSQMPVLLGNGISSPTALNALFNIYVSKNGLADPNQGMVFRADALILQYFTPILQQIQADSRAKIPQGMSDGDRKPPVTKKGKQRNYVKMLDVKTRDPVTGKIVHTKTPTNVQIYNDHYHVITADAIPRVSINSIIKYSKVVPVNEAEKASHDAMYKLTDDEQIAYREAIAAGKAADPTASKYREYAVSAIAALAQSGRQGYSSQNEPGYQRLALRGAVDVEDALARQTTKSYSLTKPKKA